MWDEVATLSLNPSYQPLNEASIPDRTLDGYALRSPKGNWLPYSAAMERSGMAAQPGEPRESQRLYLEQRRR